ncbi:polysaccharide deacetylase family protein [Plantactinospora sp. WMMB782]|uniref:polysaccharide deacetylase family protein n=1 Tax=Plantactinospora sp. WMMB782 TaxID=3404121 RepID=UPI003B9313CC
MPTLSRTHMLTVATLVTAAVLGGAYALGHTLGRPGGPFARPETRAQHHPQPDGAPGDRPADRAGSDSADGRADPGRRDGPTGRPGAPQSPTPSAGAPARGSGQPGTAEPDGTRAYQPGQLPAEPGGPYGARVSTGGPQVALTFDDGPDPRYTPQALAALREYHVKATFCLVGENAQAHPDLVRAIVADGHTLCNHTWRHDTDLGKRPATSIRADLERTSQAIRAAVPEARIGYFRQPGGAWTARVVEVARQLGMTSVHWAVDPQDWTRPSAATIATRVSTGIAPGSIVLLHDGGGNRQSTMVALYWLLPELARQYALAALPTGPPEPGSPSASTPGVAGGQPTPGGRPAAGG